MIFRKSNPQEKKLIDKSFIDLLDSMFLVAVALDKQGTIVYVNPHFYKITGYRSDEIIKRNWFDIFIPIKKMDTVKKTFEIITQEKYRMRSENPILAKDGSEIVIEWHNSPILGVGGDVQGTVSIGVDITGRIEIEKLLKTTEESSRLRAEQLQEQNRVLNDTKKGMLNLLDDSKRLEEELQKEKKSVERKVVERTMELNQEKARLEAAINSVPSGFLVTDKKNNIIIKNASVFDIIDDFHPEECTLDKLYVALKPAVDLDGSYRSCIEEKKAVLIKDVNYSSKVLEIFMAPIFISQISDEIIGAIILITNVTEEKVIERSKDEFFSIASHELRTPITAIRGNIELISKYYSDKITDKSFQEMLNDMRDSSTRLIHLVNEFLNTSRLEQGKIKFNITSFNFNEVASESLIELYLQANAKGLRIEFSPAADFIPNVLGDKDKAKEVIINLVSNAISYTDKGRIDINSQKYGDFLKVSVSDTGKGIPEQNQKLLFRKFQQANINIYTRDVSNSTGLGLYISKLLVEQMGGKIYLEKSVPNQGSTFVFTLPLASV